jgi:ribonuclease T1
VLSAIASRIASRLGFIVAVVVLAFGSLCAPASARSHTAAASAVVAFAELPPEARQTVLLIRRGGPFPYERDGVVFGNFERRLPVRERGYYREYTVPTPGVKQRGARRIVAGRGGDLYYTDDHYRSFRRIRE